MVRTAVGHDGRITLTQARFANDAVSRTGERWSVPVVARRLGQAPARAVMAAQAQSNVALSGTGPYLVNAGQTAFFRTLYDDANFAQLAARFGELDTADQLGLLLDYWAFARSGDAPFTNYLDLASRLPATTDPIVAADTTGSLLALAEYAKDRPSRAMVERYARDSIRPYFDRLGWQAREGEPVNDTLLRNQLIGALSDLGDGDVIAEVRRRARSGEAISPGIRNAVLGAYASNATAEDYDAIRARANAATDFVEKRRAWRWLASANDEALARRTLALTLGDDIPRQLRTQIIGIVAGHHPRLAWDFLVANRATIEGLLDPLQRLEFPADIASTSSDPAMVAELEAYARDFPEGARPSVAAASATITQSAQTINERMPAVEAWIAARQAPAAPQRRRRSS